MTSKKRYELDQEKINLIWWKRMFDCLTLIQSQTKEGIANVPLDFDEKNTEWKQTLNNFHRKDLIK